ncbi:hypothetical protein LB507_005612 [Fusarium sp. FIESC RH6]|nr:hypothetical protein LB507_005612 [Fusarium sp. FIESC RH6]
MIRIIRPVEAVPYNRFLLGEGPLFHINLDRDMLRIFDNALPRYRPNDGYSAAIPVRRILSYIHSMSTVSFWNARNPSGPNGMGDPSNANHPSRSYNPIDPDDDDFLDDLHGHDYLATFRPAPCSVRVPLFIKHLYIDHLPRLEEFNLVAPVAKGLRNYPRTQTARLLYYGRRRTLATRSTGSHSHQVAVQLPPLLRRDPGSIFQPPA